MASYSPSSRNYRIISNTWLAAGYRSSTRNVSTIRLTAVWDRRTVGINTRKDDMELMAKINDQLAAIKSDGSYNRMVKKWFGD